VIKYSPCLCAEVTTASLTSDQSVPTSEFDSDGHKLVTKDSHEMTHRSSTGKSSPLALLVIVSVLPQFVICFSLRNLLCTVY